MKKFQWRLDRVLEIKQKEEQARRAQLVDITQRLTQARCELFMQKRILQNLVDDLTKITPRQRLSQQAFFMRYSEANHVKIKKIEEDVRTLAAQQEEKIAEVVKIKRFNEGLEKLRAEAREAFFKEQQIREQKEQDEMTTIRFAGKAITS